MVNMKKIQPSKLWIIGFDCDQKSIDYSDNGVGFSEKLMVYKMQKTVFRQSTEYLLDSQINKGFKAKFVVPK
jgi:hypothetical protein